MEKTEDSSMSVSKDLNNILLITSNEGIERFGSPIR